MKQVWKKLKRKTGETLVETMAAILIFTFGSIIMLNMVSSAAEINRMAEEADRQYLNDMNAVEKAETAWDDKNYYVIFAATEAGLSDTLKGVPVDIYGNKDGHLYVYYAHNQKGGSVS